MTILSRYTYDPLDRLASRTPLAEAIAQRFYKAGQVVTEIQGLEQRTYLRFESQLLAQKNQTASGLLATDTQNSVLHVEDIAIAYAPYGHREQSAILPGLPGFNGEQPDPVTGHYLLGNGYRAYNPTLMRFNSPDSLSPFGEGGLNAYAYCAGDPVNRSDPTGHFGWLMGLTGLTLVSALGTGIAAVATIQSAPETSKILGAVAGGLAVGALGLGAAARFQKIASFRPPVRGLEATDLDVFEQITKYLSGPDMAALAQTSKRLNQMTNEISRARFGKLLRNASPGPRKLDEIIHTGLGNRQGIAPSQAGTQISVSEARLKYPVGHFFVGADHVIRGFGFSADDYRKFPHLIRERPL
jgi:RHS repeat-associated protein